MKKMISFFLAALFIGFHLQSNAQDKASGSVKSASVTFKTIVNGKESNRSGGPTLLVVNNQIKIAASRQGNRVSKLDIPNESTYVDYLAKKTYQVAEFKSGKRMTVETSFSILPQLELTGETAVIAGFECKKAQTVIRSNKMEVWYTEKAGFVGTPVSNLIMPNALIVRVVRNGNYETVIDKVEYPDMKKALPLFPAEWGEMVDAVAYRAKITENYITTINVFDHEQISFGNEIRNPDGEQLNVTYKMSKGTVLLKKVRLPYQG